MKEDKAVQLVEERIIKDMGFEARNVENVSSNRKENVRHAGYDIYVKVPNKCYRIEVKKCGPKSGFVSLNTYNLKCLFNHEKDFRLIVVFDEKPKPKFLVLNARETIERAYNRKTQKNENFDLFGEIKKLVKNFEKGQLGGLGLTCQINLVKDERERAKEKILIPEK